MFSHVMVGANDLEASRKFYDAVLNTLGIARQRVLSQSPNHSMGKLQHQPMVERLDSWQRPWSRFMRFMLRVLPMVAHHAKTHQAQEKGPLVL